MWEMSAGNQVEASKNLLPVLLLRSHLNPTLYLATREMSVIGPH